MNFFTYSTRGLVLVGVLLSFFLIRVVNSQVPQGPQFKKERIIKNQAKKVKKIKRGRKSLRLKDLSSQTAGSGIGQQQDSVVDSRYDKFQQRPHTPQSQLSERDIEINNLSRRPASLDEERKNERLINW